MSDHVRLADLAAALARVERKLDEVKAALVLAETRLNSRLDRVEVRLHEHLSRAVGDGLG